MVKSKLTEDEIKKILKEAVQRGYRKEMGLLEDVYRLGYEVGYYGHMEGTGWVADMYEDFMRKGREFRLGRLLKYLYEKGKEDGKEESTNKKALDFSRGDEEGVRKETKMSERGSPAYTDIPKMVRTFKPIYRMLGETRPSHGTFFRALRK